MGRKLGLDRVLDCFSLSLCANACACVHSVEKDEDEANECTQAQALAHRESEKQSRTLSRPSFLPISLLSFLCVTVSNEASDAATQTPPRLQRAETPFPKAHRRFPLVRYWLGSTGDAQLVVALRE